MTLTEIPLVVGLFLLPPLFLLVPAVVAEVGATFTNKQRVPPRLILNGALAVANVTTAICTYDLFDNRLINDPISWLAAYTASGVAGGVTALVVLVVITSVQGWPGARRALSSLMFTLFISVLSTTLAIVALLAVHVAGWAVVPLAVVLAMVVAAYYGYSRSVRERKSLGELNDFTQAVGAVPQAAEMAQVILERTRAFLKAERASLWLRGQARHPELVVRSHEDGATADTDEPAGAPDPLHRAAFDQGGTVLARTQDLPPGELRAALESWQIADAIATPLGSGPAAVGVLAVANRLGEMSRFGPDDARLLETLAAHAGVAVENARLVDRLRYDATHDTLTGLANRRRFTAALEEALALRPDADEVVAVLLLDIDAFKDVNDTLGHTAGDRLLVEAGRRLRSVVPAEALVARMGGDEFAVLRRLQDADEARHEAVALQEALAVPFEVGGVRLDVGASVGIAVFPDHAVDAVTLLQRAEVAMYAAKRAIRQVQMYSASMDAPSLHRLSLAGELRAALDNGEIVVYYQPKVHLADLELVGVEALSRWHHREQGVIPPDDFIPIAEHTGLIADLTLHVLETSLRQCADWLAEGRSLGVSVNLSVRSLSDPTLPDDVARLLRETAVPAHLLTLEITEGGVMNDLDRSLPTLNKLSGLGVRLSVDDFGAGYSSLRYLRRLPVDEVKIDKAFVLNLATEEGDLAIVRTVVDLGRHLGLTVVAEGVENDMSLRLLREVGCDEAQGWLLSRPVPRERLESWISARTVLSSAPGAAGTRKLRVVRG